METTMHHSSTRRIGGLVVLAVAIALTSPDAFALTGTVTGTDGAPIPFAFICVLGADYQFLGYALSDMAGAFSIDATPTSGFLSVQPYAPPNADGLGVYPYEPRTYQLNGEQVADLRLPATGALVLKAYDSAGNLMRWGDFASRGALGGQFMYATNLDDELRPAACWPVYDDEARAVGSPRDWGLPALILEPGEARAVNVMFWEVPGYGKLLLKADNAGAGYALSGSGQCIAIELNVELAVTAVADLHRRSASLPVSAASSIAGLDAALDVALAQADPVVRAAHADAVLAAALELRDDLELEAARAAIPSVRQGKLLVIVKDSARNVIKGATVEVAQRSHDFKFGIFDGDQYNEQDYQAAREAGFEMSTLLLGWGWMEKNPNEMLEPAVIDAYYGISAQKDMGFALKAHGAVWMQDGILPSRAYSMPWADVQVEALDYQQGLLSAFTSDIELWEAVNEPAATNVIGMPRYAMENMVALAASNVKAFAGAGTLVNSGHETDYGRKYLYYGLDNEPVDDFTLTYLESLKQAEASGCLGEVDTIGLQFYPGYKLSAAFNYLEGPAMTPSWLVDNVARYAELGRPIHITEFSLPSFQAADWNNGYWRAPWNEAVQADYAEAVFTLAFANPNVESITWWDLDDVDAAVIGGGLIDQYGRTKEVYARIKNLIAGWTTQDDKVTNRRGRARFVGFTGEYDVTVTLPTGQVATRQVTLETGVSTVMKMFF